MSSLQQLLSRLWRRLKLKLFFVFVKCKFRSKLELSGGGVFIIEFRVRINCRREVSSFLLKLQKRHVILVLWLKKVWTIFFCSVIVSVWQIAVSWFDAPVRYDNCMWFDFRRWFRFNKGGWFKSGKE